MLGKTIFFYVCLEGLWAHANVNDFESSIEFLLRNSAYTKNHCLYFHRTMYNVEKQINIFVAQYMLSEDCSIGNKKACVYIQSMQDYRLEIYTRG